MSVRCHLWIVVGVEFLPREFKWWRPGCFDALISACSRPCVVSVSCYVENLELISCIVEFYNVNKVLYAKNIVLTSFFPPAILCTSALTFHRLCSVSIEKRLDAKICSRAKYYHLCILKMPIRILSKMLHGFHGTRKLKCKGQTYYSNEEELQLAPTQHWRTMNQRAVSSYSKRQSFVPVCTICSFHITCVFFFYDLEQLPHASGPNCTNCLDTAENAVSPLRDLQLSTWTQNICFSSLQPGNSSRLPLPVTPRFWGG